MAEIRYESKTRTQQKKMGADGDVIVGGDILIYTFKTSPHIHVNSYVNNEGEQVPGLYDILEQNQNNGVWPYTLVNACAKYKDDKGWHKPSVPLEYVSYAYSKYPYNLWMFQIVGPGNEDLVIRVMNDTGTIRIRAFPTNDPINPERKPDDDVESFINVLYEAFVVAGESDGNDGYEDASYEIPEQNDQYAQYGNGYDPRRVQSPMRPNTDERGIVPTTPQPVPPMQDDVHDYDDGDDKAVGNIDDGNGLVAFSVLSMIAFGVEAVLAYMSTAGGLQIAGVFGILTLIALCGFITALVQRGKAKSGRHVSFALPKLLIYLCIAVLIVEIVALVAVIVMYVTQTLPQPLHFLYDVL